MAKLFLLFPFILLASCSAPEGPYAVYQCKTKDEAYSCPNSCTKDDLTKGLTYDFEVSPTRGSVIHKTYRVDYSDEHELEGCKVVDENNWVCKGTKPWEGTNYDFHYSRQGEKLFFIYGDGTTHNLNLCAVKQ
jgi:hypothetical protein